jgi:hypothetical protein
MQPRVVVALLARPTWVPPGVDPLDWRLALAEDLLDVLASLAVVDVAVAVDADSVDLPARVGWPGLTAYAVASLDVRSVAGAVARDGYEQAVLLAADAPDLPGMLIAKLLRPLTTKPAAAAPAVGEGPGLLGLGLRLPAPLWLPQATLDVLTPAALRSLAPEVTDVGAAPGWHRLRSAADLRRLDPRLEGWDSTRALLSVSR